MAGTPLRVKSSVGNFVGNRDHFSRNSTFSNDFGISNNVGGAWRIFHHLSEINETACVF